MSLRLNLGCGSDVRDGYVNVDFREGAGVTKVDLSRMPWPWADKSVDEILMLDFLEHFSYRETERILLECWRILKINGDLVVQVPDLDHVSRAAVGIPPFDCNSCGYTFRSVNELCGGCRSSFKIIRRAAIARLFGGQDYVGNWHQTAFTFGVLTEYLEDAGFHSIVPIEVDHQYKNWNLKVVSKRSEGGCWG